MLRWSIASGVALIAMIDGSLRAVALAEPTAVPAEVSVALEAWGRTVAALLTAAAAPPLIAQVTVYWMLERQLRSEEELDELTEWVEHRAAIRESGDGQDSDSAELCAIGDFAVAACTWPRRAA